MSSRVGIHIWLWLGTLLAIPLLSITGRSVQLAAFASVPLPVIAFTINTFLVAFALVYLVLLLRVGGRYDALHLLWLAALSFFLYGNLPFVEKIHVALFGLFGFFSYQIFSPHIAVIISVSLSFLDELLQYFLVSRVGDWRDVRLNLFSAFLGVFLAYLLMKNQPDRQEASEKK